MNYSFTNLLRLPSLRQFLSFSTSTQPLRLNALSPSQPCKQPKRLGRGVGTGHAKTSGKGHKGSGQRSRRIKQWFEGGQTPLWRRVPKRGFVNKFKKELAIVNLEKILSFILQGRIKYDEKITMKTLYDSGVLGNEKMKHGLKILAGGLVDGNGKILIKRFPKLQIEATQFSSNAKKLIESVGGTAKAKWFNRVTLRAHLKPEKFDILPRFDGIPPPKQRWRYEEFANTVIKKPTLLEAARLARESGGIQNYEKFIDKQKFELKMRIAELAAKRAKKLRKEEERRERE